MTLRRQLFSGRGWPFGLAAAYFVAAALSVWLTRFGGGVACIWFATAILVSRLCLAPPSEWLRPLILCGVTGGVATTFLGLGPLAAPAFVVINLGEAAIAAGLLQRWIARPGSFESIKEVARFTLAASVIAPAAVAPFAGVAASAVTGTSPLLNAAYFFGAHALGTLAAGPLLLLISRGEFGRWLAVAQRRDLLEAAALVGAMAAATTLVFAQTKMPLLFLPLLPALIATFRIGRIAAAASIVILIVIGAPLTLAGSGPVALIADGHGFRAQFFQFYLVTVVWTILPAAAELQHRKRLFSALRESEARYRLLADRSGDVILNVRRDGVIAYASPSLSGLYGLQPSEVLGKGISGLIGEDHLDLFMQACRGAAEDPSRSFVVEYLAPSAVGQRRWFEAIVRAIPDGEDEAAGGAVCAIREITGRKRREDLLTQEATTDPLTGLANRRAFAAALDARIDRIAMTGEVASVAVFDLDHFKSVNDRFGHSAGDAVLVAVAKLAQSIVREGDLVGRLGGEEFGMILSGADPNSARQICERLRLAVAALAIDHGSGARIAVTMSSGIAAVRPPLSRTDIMETADAALYEAKRSGRNRVALAA